MKLWWRINLALEAQRDFANILHWTVVRFGKAQARTYDKTLRSALKELTQGSNLAGCKAREDVGPGIRSLRVARKQRKGRHFVLFRADEAERRIDVLRLLHDNMDLAHLGPNEE